MIGQTRNLQGLKTTTIPPIPKDLVPADAAVEIDAKVHAGYEGGGVHKVTDEARLACEHLLALVNRLFVCMYTSGSSNLFF